MVVERRRGRRRGVVAAGDMDILAVALAHHRRRWVKEERAREGTLKKEREKMERDRDTDREEFA